jgi:hypothetical protein
MRWPIWQRTRTRLGARAGSRTAALAAAANAGERFERLENDEAKATVEHVGHMWQGTYEAVACQHIPAPVQSLSLVRVQPFGTRDGTSGGSQEIAVGRRPVVTAKGVRVSPRGPE